MARIRQRAGQAVSSPGNAELGEFLRTRWSHMDPGKAGIPESTRRRVPGLRRQELARLASISPDYYTQLEQGRHPTASPAVLDALARALLLSADERAHLYALAQAVDPDPPPPTFLPGGSAQMPTG